MQLGYSPNVNTRSGMALVFEKRVHLSRVRLLASFVLGRYAHCNVSHAPHLFWETKDVRNGKLLEAF